MHVVVALLAASWMLTTAGGVAATALFANVAEAAISLYAATACARTAAAARGSARWAWALLSAGTLSWFAGQMVWTWYENVAGVEVPFPSIADVGYLALVPLTVAGAGALITLRRGAVRTALDGLIIAGSLFYLSWATVLGPLYHAGAGTNLEWLVTLAYPAGDVVVSSMMFILLAQVPRSQRVVLGVLGAGYVILAAADTAFAYQVNSGSYTSTSVLDIGWMWGFLAIGAAAALQRRYGHEHVRVDGAERVWMALPYVPLSVAIVASVVVTVHRGTVGPMLYTLSTVLVVLVVSRQLLSARDNERLTGVLRTTVRDLQARETELRTSQRELVAREEQLKRLAFTDALTGLANRSALFARIDELSAWSHRDGYVTMLYIDLDGFKEVNDQYGHAVGDLLLVAVADRMRDIVADDGLIARLGGDEFAILAEHTDKNVAEVLATRLISALDAPFAVAGHVLISTASVGAASQPASQAHRIDLLHEADAAMYAAKTRGKARYHVANTTTAPPAA